MGWITMILVLIILAIIVYKWVAIFNDFQFLYNKAAQKLNDVEIILKQRVDNINALAGMVLKYNAHEYDTITKSISERGNTPIESAIEKSLVNVKAVQEQYPALKADSLFNELMDRDTEIEINLKDTRKEYNRIIQHYNTMINQFPSNVVAKFHKLGIIKYFTFANLQDFQAKKVME
jgi:LemA protein